MENEIDEQDQKERERLRTEIEDEFENPVEATPEDAKLEEETPLTGEEEKWQEKMLKEVKDWKRDQSQYSGVERHISGIRPERLEKDDCEENIKLYHAYQQAKKSPSPYFRQKRDRLLRRRIREAGVDYESSSYHFAKIIEALSQTE
jgi:hypothetical protein